MGAAGSRVASARAGNVIGGGDWAKDRLLPDIVRAVQAGRPVIIRNPDAIRPWQHVLEPLRGYLALAEALVREGTGVQRRMEFRSGKSDTYPVSWIVERMTHAWGDAARWELDRGSHPHEAHYLKLDCSKAKSVLGWTPALQLSVALDWIAAWYKEFYRKCSDTSAVRDLALQEIARYEELLRC